MTPDELDVLWEEADALEDLGEAGKALRLFRRGATAGHAECANRVSSCYSNGSGTGCDLHEALRWSKVAVRLGSPFLSNIAIDYALLGNWRRARHWWERALASGELEAGIDVALCLLVGKGARRDPPRALRLLETVTRLSPRAHVSPYDREEAMALVGALSAKGLGAPRSARRARQWLRRANADDDYPEVARALGALDTLEVLDLVRRPVWRRLREAARGPRARRPDVRTPRARTPSTRAPRPAGPGAPPA